MQREVAKELILDIHAWINKNETRQVVYTRSDKNREYTTAVTLSSVPGPEKSLDELLESRFDFLEIRFFRNMKLTHPSFILFFKKYELTGIYFCTNHLAENDAKVNIINNKIIYSNIFSQPFELKNINMVKDLYECVRKKHIDEFVNFHKKIDNNYEFNFSHIYNYFESLPLLHVLQQRLDTLDLFENNIIEIEI